MRCGRLHCKTPTDSVRQVKSVTLCASHRLMLWGQFEPASKQHRLTPEQRAEKYRLLAQAKAFKKQESDG
jgi:hypothetical protein